ncbi:pyruvate/ketoisovalerate oxidoreductase, gamma subunit [Archaeoglobus profundus DSM 5631]|uniref:pyruvate synthase n=1 Tax=Archaeoglobus profundus (strain DSM 5631 / JCM 9629 / NBRC 100127 / Av18) TaxID=572546 RepID=D2RDC2_ARCPA|nr:pyruvate/ketoisovalerate oxidoreductase, gamma subunit [Archaeoglobus profundus DSM 5631]
MRFHGRGGQGVVTAADILAVAAFKEGYWTLSFPMFGAEKRGGPVVSYLKISESKINDRDEIYEPDYAVVLDPTILSKDVVNGLKGWLIANYPDLEKAKEKTKWERTITIDATKLALEILGRPITNTAMVGAFAGFTKIVKLSTLKETIYEWFEKKNEEIAKKNVEVAERAYREVEKYADKLRSSIKTA